MKGDLEKKWILPTQHNMGMLLTPASLPLRDPVTHFGEVIPQVVQVHVILHPESRYLSICALHLQEEVVNKYSKTTSPC